MDGLSALVPVAKPMGLPELGMIASSLGMRCRARAVASKTQRPPLTCDSENPLPALRRRVKGCERVAIDRPGVDPALPMCLGGRTVGRPPGHDRFIRPASGKARDRVCPSIPPLTCADAVDQPCPLKAVAVGSNPVGGTTPKKGPSGNISGGAWGRALLVWSAVSDAGRRSRGVRSRTRLECRSGAGPHHRRAHCRPVPYGVQVAPSMIIVGQPASIARCRSAAYVSPNALRHRCPIQDTLRCPYTHDDFPPTSSPSTRTYVPRNSRSSARKSKEWP